MELVYRMRTCAAALLARSGDGDTPFQRMYNDAADLLVEASNLLDEPELPLGEQMELLPPAPPRSSAIWGGDLPAVAARPCPSCGSIDARTVHRTQRKLMLTCPTCAHQWEYA